MGAKVGFGGECRFNNGRLVWVASLEEVKRNDERNSRR